MPTPAAPNDRLAEPRLSSSAAHAARAPCVGSRSFYRAQYAPRPSGASGLLGASLLHLRRPDSRSLEAVLHVTADASAPSRALLALVNPTARALPAERLVVPLYYAGLAPGATVTVAAVDLGNGRGLGVPAAPQQHVLGADKGAGPTDIVLEVSLPPRSYAAYLVSVAAGVEL